MEINPMINLRKKNIYIRYLLTHIFNIKVINYMA